MEVSKTPASRPTRPLIRKDSSGVHDDQVPGARLLGTKVFVRVFKGRDRRVGLMGRGSGVGCLASLSDPGSRDPSNVSRELLRSHVRPDSA